MKPVAAFLYGLAAFAFSFTAAGQDAPFPGKTPFFCSMKTVSGIWAFNEDSKTGTQGVGEAIAFVGFLKLSADGKAAIQYRGYRTSNPETLRTPAVINGTWTVADSCLGEIDFDTVPGEDGGVHMDQKFVFIAVERATELFFARNDPVEKGRAKRLD